MFSFKANNKIWSATVAALTVLCLAVSIWATALLMPADIFKTASAANTVTNTPGDTVGLDELCERYNVEYIYVPGGESTATNSYWQKHPELRTYGFKGIYNSNDELNYVDNNTTLNGWKEGKTFPAGENTQRSLVVVPAKVKKVEADGSTAYKWNKNGDANQAFVGIAFEEDSQLESIGNSAFYECDNLCFCILPQKTTGHTGNITIGASAFSGTASLRTLVLPERVTTIGANAFENAYNLYHISIPGTVTSIGSNAFKGAYALCDVEVDSNDIGKSAFPYVMNLYGTSTHRDFYEDDAKTQRKAAQSWLYVTGDVDQTTENIDRLVFCRNTLRTGTLATTSDTNTPKYTNERWYFITLGGPEDKSGTGGTGTTQYVFPDELELTAQRNDKDWDYINSAGKKVLNTFTGDNVTEYDINIGACHNLYFSNVILSNAVSVIGDYAFRYSHVFHAEISSSVTHIGTEAFRGTGSVNNQWYYIKKTAGNSLYVGTYAFQMAMGWGNPVVTTGSRKFIFSNQKAYSEENSASKYNGIGDYNVTFTYLVPVKTNVDDGGTVTKEIDSYRLAGSGSYNYTLDGNGYSWSDKSNVAMPNIEGNDSTVWYSDEDHQTEATRETINTALSGYTTSEINLYTKKIGAPTVDVQSYDFTESLHETFYSALGLAEDGKYSTDEQADFINFNNASGKASEIHHAGTYTIGVNLDPKWGRWSNSLTYGVTVNQAKINLGKIANLPKWSADGGSELGGSGDGVPLYRYGNEWYLYQQAGLAPDFTSSPVVNSYVRYTGSAITVVPTSGSYANYIISASGEHSATNSGEYYSSFTFSFDPNAAPNYIFTKEDAETAQLNLNGVTVTLTGTASAQVSKHWYIVKQQNWFIDETSSGGDGSNYVITTRGTPAVATTTWEYEATDITVHIPKLANNDPVNPVEITFTMSYGSTLITGGDTPVAQLPNYINSAMPAGVYTVIISAGAVGSFPAISERIVISVDANDLDLTDIHSTLKGKSFEHVWNNGNLYLHDDITSLIENLNGKLNTVWKNLPANTANIWKAHSEYYNDVAIAYNLDRMQSSTYYTAQEMASRSDVPKAVGQYNVYYSLSALNYNTVGGTNDTHRRDYIFYTTIYREISANNLISSSQLTYTGFERKPAVTYSQYYEYAFNDEGYINVGNYMVTVTISDNKLTRWNTSDIPSNVSVTGGVATVTFAIIKADNGWSAVPQIPSWSYNGFDRDTYTINALHNFEHENLTVYYGIKNDSGEWVELGEYGLNKDGSKGGNYFNVDESGKVDANIAAILNKLKPGVYSLVSYITGNDNINYYDTSVGNYNRIVIKQAANRWTTAPNIMSWTWGRYDPDVNKILAEAEYPAIWGDSVPEGLTVPEIKFSIRYYDGNTINAALDNFTLLTGGEVPAAISEILGALPVGRYKLITNLDGTDYYSKMLEQTTPFAVSRATNYWNGNPNVTAWKWSEYDKTTNTIVATPAYAKGHDGSYGVEAEEDPVVKFTLLELENGKYVLAHSALLNFTATNGIVDDAVAEALRSLDAGTYYLVSSMEGKANYTAINEGAVGYDFTDETKNATLAATGTRFVIGKIANSWDVTPGIVSWDYKNFVLSNFTQGEPKFTVADSVVSYAIYEKAEAIAGARKRAAVSEITVSGVRYILIGEYTTAEELEAAVKNLSVNDYVMRATYEGTDNYEPLSREGQFSVTKANNRWTVTPVAYSYTYGKFTVQPDDPYGWLVPVAAHGTVKFRIEGTDFDNHLVSREYANSKELIDALQSKENGLNAGTYSLIMSVDGTDDFGDITERTTAFNVNRVTTVWTNGEPQTAYSKAYIVLQSDESYKNVIKPESNSSAIVTFTVYDVNGGVKIGEFGFDEISTKIKTLTPGTYSIATRFAKVCNYTLLEAYTTLEITRIDNRWCNLNDGIVLDDMTVIAKGTWNNGNNLFAEDAWLKIVPLSETSEGKGDTVRYTIGNDTVNVYTYAELQAKAKEFAAGTYVITAFVGQSNEYNALSSTFRIEIEKCDNSWKDGWTIDNSIVKTEDTSTAVDRWTWKDEITWLNGEPVYGNLIYVSVIRSKDNTVIHYITIDYSSENVATAIASVGSALTSLDACGYVIRVTVPEDDNWNVLKTSDYPFSVVQINNGWKVYPHIDGDGWVFGSVHSGPKAEPKYGSANDVEFRYAPYYEGAEDDNYSKCIWSSEQPSSVGKYVLSGSLSLSGNYTGLSGYSVFNIIAAENRWVSSPNVTGWSWDGYSKTNNLFIASARSGGAVTFGIYLSKTGDNYNSLTSANFCSQSGTVTIMENELALLENIKLDENGVIIDNANGDLLKLLKALRPGTYVLKADAEAGNNYGSISGDNTFTVITASNDWLTLPSVANYIYNKVAGSINGGQLRYAATVHYTLDGTDNDDNPVNYEDITAARLAELLETLSAGSYNIYVWVDAEETENTLKAFAAVARNTISFKVLRDENGWADGHELAASLTVPYVTLHGGNYTIENLFAARPWVLNSTVENDGIIYTVLNDNGSNHFENLTYETLLANLRNLDSGSYSIRVTAAQSCNYNAISKDIRFFVTRESNELSGLKNVKTTWDVAGNTIEDNTAITATSGADSIKFTLNGKTFASYAAMQNSETLKELNAGTYTVTVSVAESNEYEAVSGTFTIEIAKYQNKWQNDWDINNSLKVDGTVSKSWSWKTEAAWTAGTPEHGTTGYLTITKNGVADPVNYINVDFSAAGISGSREAVNNALKALDKGEYTLTITVPENTNWLGINEETTFEVTTAQNVWEVEPDISPWTFGHDASTPTATPKYGSANDVVFEYKTKAENDANTGTWSKSQPTAGGEYVMRATLAESETGNYTGLSDTVAFIIRTATNEWVSRPRVTDWAWDGYSKINNLFIASARSGGKVTFGIYLSVTKTTQTVDGKETVISTYTDLTVDYFYSQKFDVTTADIALLKTFTLDGNGRVPDSVEELLKALRPGTYVLKADAEADTNYGSLTDDTTFNVTIARNGWKVQPSVANYVYGNAGNSFTAGVPNFTATVHYRLTGNGETFNDLTQAQLKEKFASLAAGTYQLYAWVDGQDAENEHQAFEPFYSSESPYPTSFSVLSAENGWKDEPENVLTVTYIDLHKDGYSLDTLFKKQPSVISGAELYYTVLDENGSATAYQDLTYGADLMNALRALSPNTFIIRVSVGQTGSFGGISKNVRLTITRESNELSGLKNEKTIWDVAGNTIEDNTAITATSGADSIKFTLNGKTFDSYAEMQNSETLKKLNAGTYTVTVSVAESNEYEAVSGTFTIEIAKYQNKWQNGWDINNSLKVDGTVSKSWSWKTEATWTAGTPEHGTTGYLTITKNGVADPVNYINVDFSAAGISGSQEAVNNALKALDKGEYTLTITVPENTNWLGINEETTFEVTTADNEWKEDPSITPWTFGKDASTPKATPKYGSANDVVFEYKTKAENDSNTGTWSTSQPSAAGEYVMRASLAESEVGNYTGLSTIVEFKINPAENGWISMPSVNGWVWDGYSKINNLFIASARSGGEVTFGIYLSITENTVDGNVVRTYEPLTEDNFYSQNGLEISDDDIALLESFKLENGQVPDRVEELLKALRPGNYIVAGSAKAGNNYGPLTDGYNTFKVEFADNGWATRPVVANYVYGKSDGSFTAAATDYATDIFYRLSGTDNANKAVSFDKLTAAELAAELAKLNAGANYNLYAWAESGETFNEIALYATSFQVLRDENGWVTGHEPSESLTVPYIMLHGENYTIDSLFKVRPAVSSGTEANDGIIYTVLNDDGSNHFENLTYETLLASLKNLDSGSYSIRVTAAQSCNYNAISKDIRFSITRAANVFTGLPVQIETTWNPDGNEIPTHEIKATSGADSIKFTLNDKTFDSYAEMQNSETLKELNAGTYTVTVSVAQSNSYVAISDTFDIVINKIDNGIEGNWDIEDSLSRKDGIAFTNGLRWYWKTDIAWAYGVPVHGQIAYVTIAQSLSADPLHYISIDYRTTNGIASAVQTVEAAIKALDAGNYVIMLTVPEDVNWNAMNVYTEFTVSQAVNDWAKDGAPYIGSWAFGADHPLPSATPLYGSANDVEFRYAPYYEGAEDDNYSKCSWSSEQPSAAGNYVLMATLRGTNNYSGISGYYKFTITNATNNWVKLPGAMPWNWNGYDKETILFFGSARSGGTVTFGIYASVTETIENVDGTDKVIKIYTDLTDKNFYSQEDGFAVTDADIAKLVSFTLDSNGQVSDEIANLLKTLRPGTYVLKADAAALNSYAALSSDTTFTVGMANNGWTTRPSVANYVFGNLGNSFTAGVPVYAADVHYVLDGYETEEDSLTAAELKEILGTLATGNYSISVWVDAGATFSAYYSAEEAYTINFRVLSAENGWENEPSDSLKVLYTTLHGEGYTLDQLFGTEPSVLSGSALYYTIMNEDGSTTTYVDLTYGEDLFNALLNLNSNSYIIRVSAGQSDSFGGISKNVRLTIMRNKNAFKNENMLLPIITWWEKDGNVIEDRLIEADFGTENMTFVLNAITYNSYEELKAAAASLDAGRYNLTVSIAQTNEYEGLSETISLVIEAGTNSWQDGWTINSSILMNNGDNDVTVAYWNWSSVVKWSGARPQYGNLVYVIISEKDTATVLHYITLDYSNDGYANAIASVGTALSALNKGDYEITVTAPADNNWKVLSHSFDFSVNQTDNGWTEDGSPAMSFENWVYNTQSGTPSASAKYGSTVIKYYTYDAQSQTRRLYGNQIPTDAGTYSVGFSVKSSDNYAGIDEEFIEFTINKAQNTSFMVTPGAVGWTWNEYKRTVNLFSGIPTTGGKVTFSVLLNGEVVEVDGTALENISLVSITGIPTGDLSRDLYVSTQIGALLAKLLANSYTLRVTVDETENYEGFYVDVSFAVTAVVNEWSTIPQVKAWAVNVWTPESTPRAVPRYGVAHISIVSTAGTRVYYEAIYDSATGETTLVNNNNYLQSAPAGSYTLIATVPAAPGCYENALEAHVEFQIFVEGSATQSNYWRVSPSIEDWRANSDGEYNVPVGEPLRGTAYFTFYKRERIDGQYVVGEKITEKDGTAVTVEGPYGYTYYIPVEPGLYFMEAIGISRDNFGEIIESDSPTPMWVRFEIYKRENRFTEDPRIADTLYLGERDSWANPTASVLEGTVTYSYRLWGSSDEYVYEIPNAPGVYELRATGSALYADDIYKSVKFEVKLSPNSWISSPTIKDGSEETGLGDPFGEALIGNEYIEYMYAYADTPDVKFKTKPTQEGTYIVYATLELDGYETLTHEWTFTISPAYDRQLLTLDIVLGIVACAVAGVAIYFAVRRYKENG